MEELAKKFVDAVMIFDEVVNGVEEGQLLPFCKVVAEEMRRRGMSEERIANTLKGASWGQQNWIAIEEEIKLAPNILEPT